MILKLFASVLVCSLLFTPLLAQRYPDDSHQSKLDRASCQCKTVTMSRIVGGSFATNHIPWQVSLQAGRSHFCGGTILNRRQVLTARHCVENEQLSDYIQVVAGANNLKSTKLVRKRVVKIQKYPKMGLSNEASEQGDIAILTVDSDFDFKNRMIKPACLDSRYHDYTDLMASGWGRTNQNRRMFGMETEGQMPTNLKQAYFNYVKPFSNQDASCKGKYLVCLKPKKQGDSVCNGDSGGPLHSAFNKGISVVGVAGFVSGRGSGLGVVFCYGPSYYHRISYYKRFIDERVGANNVCWENAVPTKDIQSKT